MSVTMLCKVVLTILFVGLTSVCCETYRIPQPEIEVFYPKGFRVSIPDSPGVRFFAFHGNINRELGELEAGVYAQDITHQRKGRWTFEERNARLHVGDRIYYWLFVIKDHLGYRFNGGYHEVRELLPSPFDESPATARPSASGDGDDGASKDTQPDCPTSLIPAPFNIAASTELKVCEQTILNATQAIISMQSQVEALRKHNQQLMTALSKYPDSKRLTLTGRIPPEDDATMTVRFLIREKLDMDPDIILAKRNGPYNITFEVGTLAEKFEILENSKFKLKNSKIFIN